jgi:hypothetical protein
LLLTDDINQGEFPNLTGFEGPDKHFLKETAYYGFSLLTPKAPSDYRFGFCSLWSGGKSGDSPRLGSVKGKNNIKRHFIYSISTTLYLRML